VSVRGIEDPSECSATSAGCSFAAIPLFLSWDLPVLFHLFGCEWPALSAINMCNSYS